MDIAVILTSLFIGFITLYIPCKKCIEDNMNHSYSPLTYNTSHSEESEQADPNKIDHVGENSSDTSIVQTENQEDPEKCGENGSKKDDGNTFLDNNQSFSLLELQGYYSIKINIKVYFILSALALLLLSFSILCVVIATVKKSSIGPCSTWFRITFLIRVILLGFYTALFNPLCFVGHSHDFFVLRLRCNPVGGIARVTRRLINQFNKPITPDVAVNV